MIKTNPLGVLLTIIFLVTGSATAGLFFTYVQAAKKLQPLRTEVIVINRNQAALQGLVSEAVEYSRRDPAIEPLLTSMGIRLRTNVALPK
jgi:hypothetical protein